ncbi:hypothetical protein CN918_28910 [Priestia megaterium]|nr:hypothetical protein CN918_28910 [Priestia megaterium]
MEFTNDALVRTFAKELQEKMKQQLKTEPIFMNSTTYEQLGNQITEFVKQCGMIAKETNISINIDETNYIIFYYDYKDEESIKENETVRKVKEVIIVPTIPLPDQATFQQLLDKVKIQEIDKEMKRVRLSKNSYEEKAQEAAKQIRFYEGQKKMFDKTLKKHDMRLNELRQEFVRLKKGKAPILDFITAMDTLITDRLSEQEFESIEDISVAAEGLLNEELHIFGLFARNGEIYENIDTHDAIIFRHHLHCGLSKKRHAPTLKEFKLLPTAPTADTMPLHHYIYEVIKQNKKKVKN